MRRAALHRVRDLRSARTRHAEVFPLYLILRVTLLFHSYDVYIRLAEIFIRTLVANWKASVEKKKLFWNTRAIDQNLRVLTAQIRCSSSWLLAQLHLCEKVFWSELIDFCQLTDW